MGIHNTLINVPLVEVGHVFNTMICKEKRIGITNRFYAGGADKLLIKKTMNNLV